MEYVSECASVRFVCCVEVTVAVVYGSVAKVLLGTVGADCVVAAVAGAERQRAVVHRRRRAAAARIEVQRAPGRAGTGQSAALTFVHFPARSCPWLPWPT